MTLGEKIMKLRKERGWSQEDLAVRLDVSRQSVSKWESMASLPDLERIVKMSSLFGVSTDFLLKEDTPEEPSGVGEGKVEEAVAARTVTLEDANEYLATVRDTAPKIAAGVSLCILSPATLIFLLSAISTHRLPLSPAAATSIGLCLLLLLVAAALALLIPNGLRLTHYAYLDHPIRTEQGVSAMVERRQEEYQQTFRTRLVAGIALCVLSILPLMISLATEDGFWIGCAVSIIFPVVAVGVYLIVQTASVWFGYQRLLEEGDYTQENKAFEQKHEPFATFFWCLIIAAYLALSFLTGRWDLTWILWPVAAMLFAALTALFKMRSKRP